MKKGKKLAGGKKREKKQKWAEGEELHIKRDRERNGSGMMMFALFVVANDKLISSF